HPYMSNPWGWIVQWRPTSFYYESYDHGDMGCVVDKCSSAITSVGNPVIWGLAPLAILVCLVAWIIRRDVRPAVILAGLAATWLPWFAYQERTIFTFYTIVMVPFVVLALTYCLTLLWGRAPGKHTSGQGPRAGRRGQAAEVSPDLPTPTDGRHRQELGAGSAVRPRIARVPAALFARRMSVGI